MENIYYSPEAFDLEIFAEVDDANASYSFDRVVVWRDPATNEYFWARDSGCSCPPPFEDTQGREALTSISSWNYRSSLQEVLKAAVDCGASLNDRIAFERKLESRPLSNAGR